MSGGYYGPVENKDESLLRIQKGMSLFRGGDVKASLREFNMAASLDKRAMGKLWTRGLALFYMKKYEKAAEQFRLDVDLNPADAEESIWHFMSVVELFKTSAPEDHHSALEKARNRGFLVTEADSREVCECALDLMKNGLGSTGSSKLRALLIEKKDEKDEFYALMYLGLYFRLENNYSKAEARLRDAVESKYAKLDNDYMIAVAKVAYAEARDRKNEGGSSGSGTSSNSGCRGTKICGGSALPKEAYMKLGDDGQIVCRVISGMWQLSGSHGYTPDLSRALKDMRALCHNGFTTFDLADHYGPAERFVGVLRSGDSALPPRVSFHTKWVPRPGDMSIEVVEAAIDESRKNMKMTKLDLVAFHWWDYQDTRYLDMMRNASKLTEKIRAVSITNFDTKRMKEILDAGVSLASNQVSFSILDTRPADGGMLELASKRGVALMCYGTLLGGFLSDKWLGKNMPTTRAEVPTASLSKYFRWLRAWGTWDLFQSLLRALRKIADKHKVKNIASVAARWVLQQGENIAVILGMRLGHTASNHLETNREIFGFRLDDGDMREIRVIQKKGNSLLGLLGDCGDEYR